MLTIDPILLILDLDETLVRSVKTPLARPPDFQLFDYHVYRRPHLGLFLRTCAEHFRLAVWTSGTADYAQAILAGILPADISLDFVWSRSRCTLVWTEAQEGQDYLKDLKKVKAKGYRLERVLALDDRPEVYARSYGNLVQIAPYLGAADDEELRLLARYLPVLAGCPNVRPVEKRRWRTTITQEEQWRKE